jgi:excisionase family DNA binding protein
MNLMKEENTYELDFEKEPQGKPVLTLSEVAATLRVHRCTISRYAKSGELRSYRIGNRRLFKTEDVWSFFDNQVAPECVSGVEVL